MQGHGNHFCAGVRNYAVNTVTETGRDFLTVRVVHCKPMLDIITAVVLELRTEKINGSYCVITHPVSNPGFRQNLVDAMQIAVQDPPVSQTSPVGSGAGGSLLICEMINGNSSSKKSSS